jgi:hypothetical protein
MRRGVAALVFATGCLSVPPFQPEAAVTYTEAGTGGTAAGSGFALHFADGAGFHFPDALMIDGTDVMGHDPAQSCFEEDEAGFRFSPTSRISANGDAPRVKNQLVPVLPGPAVVQAKLDWATVIKCDGERAPGGTSTFTVFPDGRIVRHDAVVDATTAPISATQCTCQSNDSDNGFTIATYWTLARAPFPDLYTPQTTSPSEVPQREPPPDAMNEINNHPMACLDGGAYQVAVAWRVPADSSETTVVRGSAALIGLLRELVFQTSIFGPFPWENSSALFIERNGCGAALGRARAYVEPADLTVNEATRVMPAMISLADRDGIYGGDSGDGLPGFVLETDRAELTGSVDSSFAVWLRFPRPVSLVRASREGATGPWYLPQRVDDDSWIVWFRDPLSPGQTIAIEAL